MANVAAAMGCHGPEMDWVRLVPRRGPGSASLCRSLSLAGPCAGNGAFYDERFLRSHGVKTWRRFGRRRPPPLSFQGLVWSAGVVVVLTVVRQVF